VDNIFQDWDENRFVISSCWNSTSYDYDIKTDHNVEVYSYTQREYSTESVSSQRNIASLEDNNVGLNYFINVSFTMNFTDFETLISAFGIYEHIFYINNTLAIEFEDIFREFARLASDGLNGIIIKLVALGM